LTLKLFSKPSVDHVTPMLSFEARRAEGRPCEIDLALYTRKMRAGYPETDMLFVECKSYNAFDQSDIEKMEVFTKQFPGTSLVFSTLRRTLNKNEVTMLTAVAKRSLTTRMKGGPAMPLIILTGNELFSSYDFAHTWRTMGGKFARYGRGPSHESETD